MISDFCGKIKYISYRVAIDRAGGSFISYIFDVGYERPS